jgi:hypothetical protein
MVPATEQAGDEVEVVMAKAVEVLVTVKAD